MTAFDPSRGVKRQLLVGIGRRCLRDHAGADCNEEIVGMVRAAAKSVTGGNCNFADTDLGILEHLALRAVEAGLTDGLHPQVASRAASADRSPEGQDAKRLDRNDESAVAATGGETPMPKPPKQSRSGGGNASSGNPPPSNHG